MLTLDRAQLLHELVVLGIRDLRIVEHVVAVIVEIDLPPQILRPNLQRIHILNPSRLLGHDKFMLTPRFTLTRSHARCLLVCKRRPALPLPAPVSVPRPFAVMLPALGPVELPAFPPLAPPSRALRCCLRCSGPGSLAPLHALPALATTLPARSGRPVLPDSARAA